MGRMLMKLTAEEEEEEEGERGTKSATSNERKQNE